MKKVLLVDDEQFMHRVVSDFLRQHFECEIITALGVEQGLSAVRSQEVDLVFLDINMPGERNSMFFVDTVKNDEVMKNIPIIMLSSMSYDEMQEAFRRRGVRYFSSKTSLVKEGQQGELMGVISEYIPKK